MLERARAFIDPEPRIAYYRTVASYYRKLAIIESLKGGFMVRREEGVPIIDVKETVTVVSQEGDEGIEFAQDANGLFFARIEGGQYYPIDLKLSNTALRASRD